MNLANTPTNNNNQAQPDYIKQMYGNLVKSQQADLQKAHDKNMADIAQAQQRQTLRTDADLNRTNVESAQHGRNFRELQNAYGLSSGAMAQAKLAQNNQLQKDLTLLRLQQNQYDAEADAKRNLLLQMYEADKGKIQAAADAKEAEQRLKDQLAAGQLMAGAGDFSILQKLYGLTPDQVRRLQEKYEENNSVGGYGGGYSGYSSGKSPSKSLADMLEELRNKNKDKAPEKAPEYAHGAPKDSGDRASHLY